MELLLTGNHDQALLSMVIEEARAAAEEQNGFVGRTAVQKILYFLKTRGVPMGYRFDIYHYGPFCEDVLRDADWLLADGVIEDLSPNGRYSNYAPGPALPQILEPHRETLEPLREKVREIVRALVPLRPEHLELIATLDYLHRWFLASGGNGPWKDRVVSRFFELKGDRFPREVVENTYDRITQAQLVAP